MPSPLELLQQQVTRCERCPRLRDHCTQVARDKRRAYRDQEYWGRPVPSFGDPLARLLILGLAPGAHGANRTGRMFTGDRSGEFLFRALHETGFANQPTSNHRGDGLALADAYVTASGRCAPPDNKPSREEIALCRPYLEEELRLLARVQVVVALGKLAFDNYLDILKSQGRIRRRSSYQFGHDVVHSDLFPALVASYHPSQQNTSTGRLTAPMLRQIFVDARSLLR